MRTKTLTLMASVLLAFACSFGAYAATDLDGNHYQGIGKLAGEAVDFWVDMKLDDTDIDFNVSETFKFSASYKATAVGDKLTVKATLPGNKPCKFTSSDGGSSLQGKMSINGKMLDVWALKVPSKLTPTTLPVEKLAPIVGSGDGYTAFVLIGLPQGQVMCSPAEFSLDGNTGTWKMTCDTPALQKMFSTAHGNYSVSGSELLLTDSTGARVTGTIYDDGNYIRVPAGSAQGISLTYLLIR